MQLQTAIESLGYSASSAKVYLAALSLGEAHVSDIAIKAKLPRTSVQATLEALHKDGLVNFYVVRRYRYWVAESPEKLLKKIHEQETAVREVLPELTALRKASHGKRAGPVKNGFSLFRAAADASVQPVLIANESVEIVYVNAVWEKQFGYLLADVRGKSPKILQSGKTPREVYLRMWKQLSLGKMFQTQHMVDKRRDGTLVTVQSTIFCVQNGGKKFFIQVSDVAE